MKHIRRDFYSVPWVMHAPGFGAWGCWGGKNFNFMNMVMWHIKLKGMSSRPGYTENFTLPFVERTIGYNLQSGCGGWGGGLVFSNSQIFSSFSLIPLVINKIIS